MTASQDARTSDRPRTEVRDGASSRTVAGLAAPPVTSPARSTEQTCTRCRRSGAVKVTVNVGDRRWRFCQLCLSRADKTTVVTPVTCAHPYSRARNDGGYICLDCFEPVPGPAWCADDDRWAAECARTEAGRASLATVLSLGLLGTVLVSIAGATGKVGFTLACLLVLVGGCFWRMRRAETTPHPSLEKWPADEPLAGATWPDLDPREDWRVRS